MFLILYLFCVFDALTCFNAKHVESPHCWNVLHKWNVPRIERVNRSLVPYGSSSFNQTSQVWLLWTHLVLCSTTSMVNQWRALPWGHVWNVWCNRKWDFCFLFIWHKPHCSTYSGGFSTNPVYCALRPPSARHPALSWESTGPAKSPMFGPPNDLGHRIRLKMFQNHLELQLICCRRCRSVYCVSFMMAGYRSRRSLVLVEAALGLMET